jgi:aspartyl/asparaginyl beta-hydroxylase (cupin superfamily)
MVFFIRIYKVLDDYNVADDTNVWYSFPLMYHGKVVGKVKEICPITCNLLEELGNVRIAGFSLLTPNGTLEKHQDDTGPNFKSMALHP